MSNKEKTRDNKNIDTFKSCSSYNDYMDDDELISNDLTKKRNNSKSFNKVNIKRELSRNNISLHYFHLIHKEYKILELLFDSNCISKEYLINILNDINKTYNDSIFVLLELPITFNYIFSLYGNYGINGLNISSFIQCCNMDFLYLAKIMSSMIHFTKKDVKSIFSQFCIKFKPDIAQLMCNINKEACVEVLNDNILLDNITISLKKYVEYMDNIKNNIYKKDIIKNHEISFYMIIKIFTSLKLNNLYFYRRKILCFNDCISNTSLIAHTVTEYTYLRSQKLEILDNKDFTDNQKSLLLTVPVKDELCGICYENKPNIVSLCKHNKIESKHQFCNGCMSMLLLKLMKCPICRSELYINKLRRITTDIRNFK